MCEWGTWVKVRVKVPADLSATGEAQWRDKDIDACIADLVGAIQAAGIDMRASCCGHGKGVGRIELQDGRTLIVISGKAPKLAHGSSTQHRTKGA